MYLVFFQEQGQDITSPPEHLSSEDNPFENKTIALFFPPFSFIFPKASSHFSSRKGNVLRFSLHKIFFSYFLSFFVSCFALAIYVSYHSIDDMKRNSLLIIIFIVSLLLLSSPSLLRFCHYCFVV